MFRSPSADERGRDLGPFWGFGCLQKPRRALAAWNVWGRRGISGRVIGPTFGLWGPIVGPRLIDTCAIAELPMGFHYFQLACQLLCTHQQLA